MNYEQVPAVVQTQKALILLLSTVIINLQFLCRTILKAK